MPSGGRYDGWAFQMKRYSVMAWGSVLGCGEQDAMLRLPPRREILVREILVREILVREILVREILMGRSSWGDRGPHHLWF
jgi:hypothetical protein